MDIKKFLSCPVDIELPPNVQVVNIPTKETYKSVNWLRHIFGLSEGGLLPKYRKHVRDNPPETFKLREIQSAYEQLEVPLYKHRKFTIVRDLDMMELPSSRMAKNSIMQIATQFNGLESSQFIPEVQHFSDSNNIPLERYPIILAPDSRVTMTCAHTLLKRQALHHSENPFNAFNEIFGSELLASRSWNHGADIEMFLRNEVFLKRDLLLMPMWCRPETEITSDESHVFIQVPTATLPTYNGKNSLGLILKEKQDVLAKILIVSQYAALAQMAAIRSVLTSRQVALHLTFPGRGELFNTNLNIIQDAIVKVFEVVEKFDVHVFLHAQSDTEELAGIYAVDKVKFVNEPTLITGTEYLKMSPVTRPRRVRRSSQSSCLPQTCDMLDEIIDTVGRYIIPGYEPGCETKYL